jgi:hypothetical protein
MRQGLLFVEGTRAAPLTNFPDIPTVSRKNPAGARHAYPRPRILSTSSEAG